MKHKRLVALLVAALVLLLAGIALAQELQQTVGELLWLGDFPACEAPATESKSNLENHLLQQLQAQAESIQVQAFCLTPEQFFPVYWNLLNEQPELFYIDKYLSYYTSGGYVACIYPSYRYQGQELADRRAAYEAAVDEAVAYAMVSSSTLGRLVRASDYLCMNFEYDQTGKIASPDAFFEEGKGVCQAYALAYMAIIRDMGFTCTTVTSDAMNHLWNMVQLDGCWYHVDVTWNDPIQDMPGRAYHNYFLLSDAAISKTHSGWVRKHTAGSTKYDSYFWRQVRTPFPAIGDSLYYIKPGDNYAYLEIVRWQPGGSTLLFTHSISYWDYYRPLACDGNRLYYFADDILYSVEMSGGNHRRECTVNLNGGTVYSAIALPASNQLLLYCSDADWNGNCSQQTIIASRPDSVTLPQGPVELMPGNTQQLQATFRPAYSVVPCRWSVADEAVAAVSSKGVLTAKAPGITTVRVETDTGKAAECRVVVNYSHSLHLPANLTAVEAEAFSGCIARSVTMGDKVTAIGPRAFADCRYLKMITIPAGVTQIDSTALEGSPEATVLCWSGSAAHRFALENDLSFVLLD